MLKGLCTLQGPGVAHDVAIYVQQHKLKLNNIHKCIIPMPRFQITPAFLMIVGRKESEDLVACASKL